MKCWILWIVRLCELCQILWIVGFCELCGDWVNRTECHEMLDLMNCQTLWSVSNLWIVGFCKLCCDWVNRTECLILWIVRLGKWRPIHGKSDCVNHHAKTLQRDTQIMRFCEMPNLPSRTKDCRMMHEQHRVGRTKRITESRSQQKRQIAQ